MTQPSSDTSVSENPNEIIDLTTRAVKSALIHQWDDAVNLNTQIIKIEKNNIDALNRLGFAYLNKGKFDDAKKTYQKVKKLDPYNQIAGKNLSKLELMKDTDININDQTILSPMLFLEEPGKTRLVQCVNEAPAQILSTAHCGQEVFLNPKNHGVEIRDSSNRYLAALPDDLSFKLIKFLDGKNTYQVFIKSIDKKSVTIFIRELSRGKKFLQHPSFASNQILQSYTHDFSADAQTADEKPNTTPTGEAETEDQPEA
jgi:hypothetical protein